MNLKFLVLEVCFKITDKKTDNLTIRYLACLNFQAIFQFSSMYFN